MAIIEARVEEDTSQGMAEALRELVKDALVSLGVNRKHITVEFVAAIHPERLIINYWTRSAEDLLEGNQANIHAEVVGKIFEDYFGLPVECLVSVLEKERTGIYLTPIS